MKFREKAGRFSRSIGYRAFADHAIAVSSGSCPHTQLAPMRSHLLGWDPVLSIVCDGCQFGHLEAIKPYDAENRCDGCGRLDTGVHVATVARDLTLVTAGLCQQCAVRTTFDAACRCLTCGQVFARVRAACSVSGELPASRAEGPAGRMVRHGRQVQLDARRSHEAGRAVELVPVMLHEDEPVTSPETAYRSPDRTVQFRPERFAHVAIFLYRSDNNGSLTRGCPLVSIADLGFSWSLQHHRESERCRWDRGLNTVRGRRGFGSY